jgi:hypothetical protein
MKQSHPQITQISPISNEVSRNASLFRLVFRICVIGEICGLALQFARQTLESFPPKTVIWFSLKLPGLSSLALGSTLV